TTVVDPSKVTVVSVLGSMSGCDATTGRPTLRWPTITSRSPCSLERRSRNASPPMETRTSIRTDWLSKPGMPPSGVNAVAQVPVQLLDPAWVAYAGAGAAAANTAAAIIEAAAARTAVRRLREDSRLTGEIGTFTGVFPSF